MRVMTLAVPLLVAGCISTPPAKSAGEEIIYRMENTSVLEVFNLTRLWVASMGVNYLDRRDGRYGELGGSFEFCSDAEYFCLIGGIAAAIPKKFDGQTTWQFNGISCKSDTPLAEGKAALIDCSRGNWSNRLNYSQSHGITSYSSAAEPGEQYSLIAPPGLLQAFQDLAGSTS